MLASAAGAVAVAGSATAAAAGFTARQMVGVLQKYTKFPLPPNIPTDIEETVSRYGRVQLDRLISF